MNTTFSLSEVFWNAFSKTREHLLFFVGFTLIIIFVSLFFTMPLNLYAESIHEANPLGYFVVTLVSFVLSVVVGAVLTPGIVTISLKAARGEKSSYKDFLNKTQYIVRIILASAIYFVLMMVGFFLLVIPGLFVLVRLQFAPYLIVDKNMGVIESIKKSYEITKGNTLKLFALNLLVVPALVFLGLLLLIVGILVAMPMIYIMYAMTYDKLQGEPQKALNEK